MMDWVVRLFFALAVTMAIRAFIIYRIRVGLIYYDYESYKRLPSYDAMMFMVWKWTTNQFIKET